MQRRSAVRLAVLFSVASLLAAPALAQVAVPTQHNDNTRSGANTSEVVLTQANVAGGNFGKLFTRSLDANVNGQVLYVPNLTINGAVHNVIIAYTSNNSNNSPSSLYAFDADQPNQTNALWRHQFTNSAEWTTCTPAIDTSTNTIYVVTKDNNDSGLTRLRAIDLLTGSEKTGSPVTIAATVAGSGDGSVSGQVSFNSAQANCRPALLFADNSVYIAFAHNSDSFPYHGWIFRYTYNGSAFTQANVFCTDPNGGLGGIWMAGNGLMADSAGNIYTTVGNGTFDANTGGTSYGMTVLKLSSTLGVLDYFAPFDESGNSNGDLDFGSCGVFMVPGTTRLFSGGTKFGSAFLLDSTNLGHFTTGGPDAVLSRIDNVTSDDNVGQNPVGWDSGTYKYMYLWPGGSGIEQFRYDPSTTNLNPDAIFGQNSSYTDGGSLAVSSQGTANGILWAVGNNSVVHALNAVDVTQPALWSSSTDNSRDGLGSVGHFQFPTVANGRVYVPTGSASIAVYGLLTTTATPQVSPASGSFSGTQQVTITDSTSGAAIYYTTDGSVPYPGQGTTHAYSAPFNVSATSTVNAIAFSTTSEPSAVASRTYTLSNSSPATATFVGSDSTTKGNWKGVYGGDGWDIAGDASANNPTNPSYASVTASGNGTTTSAASSLASSALQKAAVGSADRVAADWSASSGFTIDVDNTDTNTHQLALYLVDWGNTGISETITLSDAGSNNTLDTETASGFAGGVYFVWNVSGNVKITVAKTAGSSAVVSGVFVGSGSGSTAPAAPTALAAVGGVGEVSLSWTASTGATSYNVYRGTTAGAESTTPIATGVTTTSYQDSSLPAATYYYVVVGVNAVGGGFESNETTSTATSNGPPAPTGLTATGGNASVSLSWTASTGATSYNVYAGTTAGGESSTPLATGVTGTTYNPTGLTNGEKYYFTVAGVSAGGTSAMSNEASAIPLPPISYPGGVRFISSPVDFSSTPLDTLFGLKDTILFAWQPTLFAYTETPNQPADNLHIGIGYWVDLPSPVTLSGSGTPAPTTQNYSITLNQGWNAIGDPFFVSIPVASLQVNGTSFAQASTGSGELVFSVIYGYDGIEYVPATSIAPETGYWIYAFQGCTLQVPHP